MCSDIFDVLILKLRGGGGQLKRKLGDKGVGAGSRGMGAGRQGVGAGRRGGSKKIVYGEN